MCGPVCTIGIVGGLSISRLLGISDLTLGLWVGAFILSFSLQLNKILVKKKKNFPFSFWIILISIYLLSFLPIWRKITADINLSIFGLPILVWGSFLGMVVLFGTDKINDFFIKKHGRVYFYYQRVIVPLIGLIVASIIIEILL